MNDLNREIEELRKLKIAIHGLRKNYDNVEEEVIKKELKSIIITSDKIYKEVAINTNKISKIRNFANYYIATVEKIVSKYIELKNKGISSTEVEMLYAKIEQFLPKVSDGFKKMYNSLFSDETIDIDAEIKVMIKEMGI